MLMNFFYGLLTTGYHKGNILLRPKSIKILPPTGHTTILHHTEVRHGPPDYYGVLCSCALLQNHNTSVRMRHKGNVNGVQHCYGQVECVGMSTS